MSVERSSRRDRPYAVEACLLDLLDCGEALIDVEDGVLRELMSRRGVVGRGWDEDGHKERRRPLSPTAGHAWPASCGVSPSNTRSKQPGATTSRPQPALRWEHISRGL
ncbi:hypothetical protein AB0F43_31565 [Kribbella sp. NPDC023972]|uniref:hypothetical protein n=1 Tax=Kribbella sp. NPDC023972 TaxID=3154795 RepID=UPI0033FFFF54